MVSPPRALPAVTTGPAKPAYSGKLSVVDIPPSFKGEPATFRYNNPGGAWPSESSRLFGSNKYGIISGGNQIAAFDDPVMGAASTFHEWANSKNYRNQPLWKAVDTWTGSTGGPQQVANYAAKTAGAGGLDPNTLITPEFMRSPMAIPFLKMQAELEAGRPYTKLTDEQWVQAQRLAFPDLAQH
jgi:hypothetical protein